MRSYACVFRMEGHILCACILVCASMCVSVCLLCACTCAFVRLCMCRCEHVCVDALFCMPQSLCQLESERLTLVINI